VTQDRLCERRKALVGGASEGKPGARATRQGGNPMNPRVGSGMQQAREPLVEQTGEAARNRAVGTRDMLGSRSPKAPCRWRRRHRRSVQHRLAGERGVREWTPEGLNDGGAIFEQPCRRRSVTEPGGEMVSSEAERLGASGERRWQHPEHAAAHEPDEAESTRTRGQIWSSGKANDPDVCSSKQR
jgi:hypothetical protein